jgi:hypothetical protein
MSILTHVGYAINQYATMNCESVTIAHLISVKTVQLNTEKIMSNLIHFVVLNVLEKVKIKHELVTVWISYYGSATFIKIVIVIYRI